MHSIPQLKRVIDHFSKAKETILNRWISYEAAETMLRRHGIAHDYFFQHFASGVFDYFESVIRGEMQMGDCPVMANLLVYLEDHEVTSDELFVLCSHFRRAMVDISYDIGVNSREIHDEISYVFDLNFAGLLKRYTETIYQKEMEIRRNVKLLEEYRRAIDESAIVVKTDAQGKITYANARLVAVCGYTHEELTGEVYSILLHPRTSPAFSVRLGATLMGHRVYHGTLKGYSKQGRSFYVDATIVPIVDTMGTINEYMAISYEVTDLVVAKEEAIAAAEAKEYFLSNMSHEIRTPLNAVLGFVALLKAEVTGEKQRRYLDIIDSSGENLLRIINDILDFSKLRSGAFAVESHRFDLHHVLARTLELFVPSANRQGVTLISFIDPYLSASLDSDPLRLQQVLSNLLDNAIKFTPSGGEIRVEATCDETMLFLSVSDTGVGIDAEEQRRIFDPFSQGSNVDTRGGTGLGLSICAQLVHCMGGNISVASVSGGGSCFSFELPLSETTYPESDLRELLQSLDIAFLAEQGRTDVLCDTLIRYLDRFEVAYRVIDNVNAPFDLLFFSEQGLTTSSRRSLSNDLRPKIVLRKNAFEEVADSNVIPLVMPLYSAKLHDAVRQAFAQVQKDADAPMSVIPQFEGHVLVAEDDSASRELIRALLENSGVGCDLVDNGADALEAMLDGMYDAVVMDEQMPQMNGLEAVAYLREFETKKGRRRLPVIMLSADMTVARTQEGVYDLFFAKPINVDALYRALSSFLRPRPDALRLSSPVLDRTALCETLQVTPEQLQMLLDVYREKTEETLQKLENAVRYRKLPEMALLAHALKGSSSNFRFETISTLAQQIERAARAGETQYDYTRQVAELRLHFRRTLEGDES